MDYWQNMFYKASFALVIAYIFAKGFKWYQKFRRVKKFVQQFTTLNLFKYINTENDSHVKHRLVSEFSLEIHFIWQDELIDLVPSCLLLNEF